LMRRGIDLQAGREVNVLRQVHVSDVLRRDVETVPRTASLEDLYQRMVNSPHYEFFVVDDEHNLRGVISVDDLRRELPRMENLKQIAIAEDLMTYPVLYLREDDTLDCAMRQFEKRTFEELPVLPAGDSMSPIGIIERQEVIRAYNKEILKVDLAGAVSSRLESAVKLRSWETIGGYVLAEMDTPPHFCERPLESLQLRQRHGIQIILIERAGQQGEARFAFPTHDTVLHPGDRAIVFGRRENVDALAR
ncbi:MAG: CBS domain-containing protein, partial [Candidatus Eisenbacteria sp.]|nr:CBS domain-containing protein [Candidatus Eisenbacteria bacterium]